MSDLTMFGTNPLRCRAHLIVGDDGSVHGAVVVSRHCFDRWEAFVTTESDDAARVAAQVIDRGPAVVIGSTAPEVVRVMPYVARLQYAHQATFAVAEHPIAVVEGEIDGRSRMATIRDLDQLCALWELYGIGLERTRWQIRSVVRRNLERHLVAVIEDEHEIVAALAITGRTARYAWAGDIMVHPDHRQHGLSWAVASRVQAVANAFGLGVCGVVFPTNPMPVRPETIADDAWGYAVLGDQVRVRGQGRLRQVLYRYGAVEPPDLVQYRDDPALHA